MSKLSTRQQSILNRIVETHIETAQPVGSRFITGLYTDLYRSSFSPATVRAEMGLLEEKGYLTHPHTSAGRLPTDSGYRYYVDHSLKQENPEDSVIRQAAKELSQAGREDFAEEASRILSQMSEELSLIAISESSGKYRVFIQGTSRILEKPEFQDAYKVRPVFKGLEEKTVLAEWLLERSGASEVAVSIGGENTPQAFQECSVISSQCRVRGNLGAVAVVGPRRMRYAKTIPMVAWMGRMMMNLLNEREDFNER